MRENFYEKPLPEERSVAQAVQRAEEYRITLPRCVQVLAADWDIVILTDEIERLKRGEFTEEEFQNLCHNLSEADATRFCQGCENYQTNLLGSSPITQFRKQLHECNGVLKILAAFGTLSARIKNTLAEVIDRNERALLRLPETECPKSPS